MPFMPNTYSQYDLLMVFLLVPSDDEVTYPHPTRITCLSDLISMADRLYILLLICKQSTVYWYCSIKFASDFAGSDYKVFIISIDHQLPIWN